MITPMHGQQQYSTLLDPFIQTNEATGTTPPNQIVGSLTQQTFLNSKFFSIKLNLFLLKFYRTVLLKKKYL